MTIIVKITINIIKKIYENQQNNITNDLIINLSDFINVKQKLKIVHFDVRTINEYIYNYI